MTTAEAIRNYIARCGSANRAGICLYLTTCRFLALPACIAAIDRLETNGDITRWSNGTYVLTSHLLHMPLQAPPQDLELTSTDQDFGQPTLF